MSHTFVFLFQLPDGMARPFVDHVGRTRKTRRDQRTFVASSKGFCCCCWVWFCPVANGGSTYNVFCRPSSSFCDTIGPSTGGKSSIGMSVTVAQHGHNTLSEFTGAKIDAWHPPQGNSSWAAALTVLQLRQRVLYAPKGNVKTLQQV